MTVSNVPFSNANEWAVPDAVRKFVQALSHGIENNPKELIDLYNIQRPRIAERYFKASLWPAPSLISSLISSHGLLLYQEMTYRHLHTNRDCQPSHQDRINSFKTYRSLFNLLLNQSDSEPELVIPSEWQWDMVSEFVRQKFEWDQYIANSHEKKNKDSLTESNDDNEIWSMPIVLQYLHALVSKGRVPLQLNKPVLVADAGDTGAGISPSARCMAQLALIALADVSYFVIHILKHVIDYVYSDAFATWRLSNCSRYSWSN
jgi:hypothetical protein